MNRRITRNSIRKLNCICFVLSVLFCMTVEIKYLDAVSIPTWLDTVLILTFCSTGILIELPTRVSERPFVVLLLIMAYLLVYAAVTQYGPKNFLRTFFLFIPFFFLYSFLLQKSGGFRMLLDTFVEIMILIGCISVFFWLFGSVMNILPGRTHMTYTWTKKTLDTYTYYLLYFENPGNNQMLLGLPFTRNCGIFTEAPAYAGVLLYAIGIELYSRDKIKKARLIPLLITVLTVQSTKAYVILVVLFAIQFLTRTKEHRTRAYLIARVLTAVFVIVASAFVLWYIMEDKSGTFSFAARINHMKGSFRTWLQNPLFGAGFRNNNAVIENQEADEAGYGATSMGLLLLLAYGGIYLLAFYVFAFFYALKNPRVQQRKKGYLMFSLMLLLNLFISNSAFGKPYMFMISSAYAAGAQNRWKMLFRDRSGGYIPPADQTGQ